MKKIKKLFFKLFVFISLFMFSTKVKANTINNIEMDVYIDKNGHAEIIETWNAYLNQGTEGYRPYTNMGNSNISNFIVTDETGITYENLSNWNISASFNDKAYKSGINYISNGLELCWGISKYGNKTYTLKYNINNFVTQYTDAQGIYFNFINLDQYVGNAKITIHSDYAFSLDNARIWAFGNNGTINFENGNIVLNSNGSLNEEQYMVALIRFETNLFSTSNKSTLSFDDVYDSAMKGVTIKDKIYDLFEFIFMILKFIFKIVFIDFLHITVFVICFFVWRKESLKIKNAQNEKIDFGTVGTKLPSYYHTKYWREIPCDKNFDEIYWCALNYKIVSNSALQEGIIGALLLKFIKEGKISVIKTKRKIFNFKDNNYALKINNVQQPTEEIEKSFFKILKNAAGYNNILEEKELKRWCRHNYKKIKSWFEKLSKAAVLKLEKEGYIISKEAKLSSNSDKVATVIIRKVEPKLKDEAIKIKGLMKFLLEFSLINKKEYYEVHIWEEYLIFATLLGIADKVEEQFSQLYPKFKEEMNINYDVVNSFVHNFYEQYDKSIKQRYKKYIVIYNEKSNNRKILRSSGGGGSSYSGGGSSSGGSSGGGFR